MPTLTGADHQRPCLLTTVASIDIPQDIIVTGNATTAVIITDGNAMTGDSIIAVTTVMGTPVAMGTGNTGNHMVGVHTLARAAITAVMADGDAKDHHIISSAIVRIVDRFRMSNPELLKD